jgi:glycosyltransferase involved in cell wall biosynthesis
LTALRKHVETAVYRRANEIIVLSEAFRRIVINDFGILPARVHVVRPGVDLERFHPLDTMGAREQLGLGHGRVVLSVRRLVKRVGLDILLQAWGAAEFEDATLYIVGDGPERRRLQTLADNLGVVATVRFVGRVPDNTLPLWYAAADVSVVPSLALEGFGLVVLESLASGTPVLASDTGGMAEVLPGLGDGLLVPAGDISKLAVVLSAALRGDHVLPAREDCRRFAESFRWTKAADGVVEIFEQARARPPSRKYRVVFLDHSAKLSGGELSLLGLIDGAATTEAHVILAEDGPLVERLQQLGVSTEVLPLRAGANNLSRDELQSPARLLRAGSATATYTTQLARRLRRLHPDLVHTNSLKASLYGSIAARAAGIPVVLHLHDRLSADNYPASQAAVLRRCVRSMADAVIANSAATAQLLGEGRAPVWVIPSPVDITPAPHSATDRPVVGIVGRLAPWKGQHIFIDAMALVSRHHPNLEARVIGSALFDEEEYVERLTQQVHALHLANVVQFVGFSHDVAVELAGLTVAVHASLVPEPFGRVVIEAMACGVPIVATDGGGPAEIIQNGYDGFLVPLGDADALAAAVLKLLADASLRTRLAKAGARKVRRYRPEQVAAEVEAVYASVLTSRPPTRSQR